MYIYMPRIRARVYPLHWMWEEPSQIDSSNTRATGPSCTTGKQPAPTSAPARPLQPLLQPAGPGPALSPALHNCYFKKQRI